MKRTFIIRNDIDRERLLANIRNGDLSRPWKVDVSFYKKRRSLAQNALLWMWMHEIREHIRDSTGKAYSDDELHEWFKDRYLPTKVVELNGKAVTVRKSTAALTTMEFSDYLNVIDAYCADELHLQLTHPELYGEAMR